MERNGSREANFLFFPMAENVRLIVINLVLFSLRTIFKRSFSTQFHYGVFLPFLLRFLQVLNNTLVIAKCVEIYECWFECLNEVVNGRIYFVVVVSFH